MLRVGTQYNVELQRIVNLVKKSIDKELIPAIKQVEYQYVADEAWPDRISNILNILKAIWSSREFDEKSKLIAGEFVSSTVKSVDKKNKAKFGINAFGNSEKMSNYLSAATTQNANLIKSIPEQYLNNVANTVLTGMRNGVLARDIAKQLSDDYGVTQRRARFIARDQTAKVNGEIDKRRQVDAGFEYFQWLDSDDERVRHKHRLIADKKTKYGKGVYRWDDLPKNDKGETIQPGSDFGCRCTARAKTTESVEKYMNRKSS
ncbi:MULTISPECIES: phage minor head protein [unclassified Methylophaga]|jgi:SPP1 gp7 family putative phage head morphogenesis protein|uniref:phage head morphogenesis protein n=3 Tax=Methylophaga TaxID=40222 RepID=UPI00259CA3D6|nr:MULTISPECIES: phage minor head protein [unclassified Methylophaga]|tara:strand:- start:20914 stop:21696 length:783 start_codon:yes stop_codon:yes gene_type:complete